MRTSVRPGRAIPDGDAPSDGYVINITVRELFNDAFMSSLSNWVRGRLLAKFPAGVVPDVIIQIGGKKR